MSIAKFDLVVIGSGPAGHHGAIQASKLGKRVALVERPKKIGGVCFNTGTIPSKTLREAVMHLSGIRQRGLYGESYRVKSDITMEDLLFRCKHVVNREVEVYRTQFARNGINIFTGEASFVDKNHVRVVTEEGELELEAQYSLIATGTMPAKCVDFPVDGGRIIDGDGIFCLSQLPKTMIVVGGGVIGLEYACMFAALGTHVTMIDGRTRLLEFVDAETIEALMFHMRQMNITFRLGETVERVELADDGNVSAFTKSNKLLRAQTALYAVGRQGATAELNLENVGIKADSRGRIKVNEQFQTDTSNIYAAGDVIGFPSLASCSMEQGRIASANAFGHDASILPGIFPYGIYTIPEISFVGKTEEELTHEAIPYEVGIAHFREIARGNILGDTAGQLKLIFNREDETLLGVHVIGEGATELVHIGQAVMAFGGTIRYFVEQVFNYPTLAECYKVAALHGINKQGAYKKAA